MISAVINTLNEERNLPHALASLKPWVDEIVVVDMHSEDRTVEIAERFGARVFSHERIAAFDGARRFAVEQAKGDWVFLLDADEIAPPGLARLLLVLSRQAGAEVYAIPRENYLLGAMMAHTGWGPEQDRQARFFRRDAMAFTDRIHAFMAPAPGARRVELPYRPGEAIVHFNYLGIAHFVSKMNGYTDIEAAQAMARGERRSRVAQAKALLGMFVARFIRARGYKDGWRGFVLSAAMVFYQFLIFAKMEEAARAGSAGEIRADYARIAAAVNAGYADFGRPPP